MSLLPISLGVGRSPGAGGTAFSGRMPSREQIEKVLWRDGFSCRCCGFTSKRFQRVVLADDPSERRSLTEESLITVCTSCELCLSLDRAGMTGAGSLIWLPELSQTELNHVTRALFVAMATEEALAKAAARTLDVLKGRKIEAKKRLGTDDPLILATALQEKLDAKAYAARTEKLEGIRLMPDEHYIIRQRAGDVDIFPQMVSYWTSPEGPFSQKPVAEWGAMFESIAQKVE